MSRRLKNKPLGPSNDVAVPEEEFVLAKMLQSAKTRGLKACTGEYYKYNETSQETEACCALGAWRLDEPDIGTPYPYLIRGNDGWETESVDALCLTGYSIGAAFQDAMREDGDS
jgi:hypothetical protein